MPLACRDTDLRLVPALVCFAAALQMTTKD